MKKNLHLFYTDYQLDKSISEIKNKIRLSMNGVISDTMKAYGIEYQLNYGVSIPRLKEIASGYTKNYDLAKRLWMTNIRETKILATMLVPVDTFDEHQAQSWILACENTEIAEQLAMNFFKHLPHAADLALSYIQSCDSVLNNFGWMLAGRIPTAMQKEKVGQLLTVIEKTDFTPEKKMLKNIAVALAFLCRTDRETAMRIHQIITQKPVFQQSENVIIQDRVLQELFFLNYMPEDF